MKSIFKIFALFACVSTLNLFGQSQDGLKEVTVNIVGVESNTPIALVSLPVVTVDQIEQTTGTDITWRKYHPGQTRLSGLLVLERPLPLGPTSWRYWFDDTAAVGQRTRKTIQMSFTSRYATNTFVFLSCYPVSYQLAAKPAENSKGTNSVLERIEIAVGEIDYE